MQQQFGVFQLVLAQLLAWNNLGDPLINLLNPTQQPLVQQQDPQPVQHAPALSESQGQSHVAPAQQPLPDDVTRRLDSLEKLVAEQPDAPPPHHNTDSIPHPLNTNITLEPYPTRIAAVIQGLQHERFRDSLIKHPVATFNAVNDRSLKFITAEEYALSQKPVLPKNQNPDWRNEGQSKNWMKIVQSRGPMSTSTSRFEKLNSVPPNRLPISTSYMDSFQSAEVKHQNQAEKRKFDDVDWKNQPITFTPADFDTVFTPHNNPLVTSVMINSCERYDGPIYGFNNQPVQVEGVLTLNVAFGSGRTYVTPSVRFLIVKMASSFNAVIGRPTLTEIRAVVSQSHICMKFLTSMGIATLRGVEIIDNQPEDETRATLVEDVEEVQLDDRYQNRTTHIGTRHDRGSNLGILAQAQHQSIEETSSPEVAPFGGERLKVIKEEVDKLLNLEVYVDDIVVKSLKVKDHLVDLDETFNNLRKNKMQLNPAKCIFGVELGKFLGFMVSQRGIEVNPEKIKAIIEMEPPKSDDSGKQKKFACNSECQVAFEELKFHLSSPPLLTKAIDGEILYLYLGISDEAISSVLVREEGKQQKPVYYTSSVLHRVKLRYPIVEKVTSFRSQNAQEECTPALPNSNFELSSWILYVDGASSNKGLGAGAFLVGLDGYRSEHALKFNFDVTNNMAKYEALLLGLQLALELKVMAIQVYSDSQLVVNQVNSVCEVIDFVMMKYVALVAELKCKFQKFCFSKISRTENEQADSLSKFASDNSLSSRSIFVKVLDEPNFMKPRMMEISTDLNTSSWIDPIRCPKCQFFAHLTHQPAEELTNLVAPWPFAQWGLDLLGPFMKGVGGVTHLIVGVDYFMKWVETRPLSSLTYRKVEDFVFSSIICRYGIPNQIVVDNVYHPESNGMVDSVNKAIIEGIKLRLEQHKARWADELNNVLWAYRNYERNCHMYYFQPM
ncbi:hypothetical protein SLEP1_g25693 [Rubroshorea leprosula]|uniref:Uncharacterized protein n=1 Tax=Rubroshorea leprosula TaxID=152421 RepID=A0AAV5JXA5_9ROSI|nr:hypothetical protein SLEP1_g25693 [Rubroshorea leprosula]